MKKLFVFLKDYKKESILGPFFKLLEASFELIIPLVVASVIDKGIGNNNNKYVYLMGLIMIILGVIGLICSITAQYFAAKAAVGFSTKLRHGLFKHIQSLSFSEMDTIGTSTLITRMTADINQVQNGVNLVLRLFLRSPFIVFGAMIMAFSIDTKIASIFVITIILLSAVVFTIMAVSIPLYKKVQNNLDKVLGDTKESLEGIRVTRAFNRQKDEINNFNKDNAILTKAQLFVGRISALMNPLTYIIINVATVYLIYAGGLRVNVGSLTQGQVVALVNYMSQILIELIKLANLIINVTKSVASANRIVNIFDINSSINDEDNDGNCDLSCENIIQFKNVSLNYNKTSEEALTDINFSVKKGETIGIIGGTGSGKSSIVNLIPRFYDSTKGQVLINGQDVKRYKINDLRRQIGIVMQKAVLFTGTIKENLLFGNQDANEEDINRALEISQSKEFVEKKEEKLDYFIEQGGKNLSGGQRQRLTIARALVRNPKILILDDSASALDFATDARLRKALSKLKNELTVLIVSQRTSSIMHADKILVLDDGKIVGSGTHEELLNNCEVYKEIYYSQYRKDA